jgi:hypothetical protein
MTDAAPLVSAADLARTYRSPDYEDAWRLVEDYRRATDHAARHPEPDMGELAARLDLPRSRLRRWLGNRDDGEHVPDAVRGVRAAEERGWVPVGYESRAFRATNRLVAWVLSRGEIREGFVPVFEVEEGADRARLIGAFDDLGVDYAVESDPDGATGHRPITHPSVLGRVLSLLGAPVGDPGGPARLPAYLERAPASIRHDFLDVYLRNRGHRRDEVSTILREERPDRYLRELAALVGDVSGGETAIGEGAVVLSADAVRGLKA